MSEILVGKVIALSSEGQGIVRENNLVVFIPFTTPGDTIRYHIVKRKKNFATGKLLAVLKPSLQRAKPLCRYYGECGGCQLQHLAYEAQLKNKREIIENALIRIGKFSKVTVLPVVAARMNWMYRRHITLKIIPHQGFSRLGYIAIDNQTILPIKHCPLFLAEEDLALAEVQTLLGKISSQQATEGKATLFKTEASHLILSLNFEKLDKIEAEIIEEFLKQFPRWKGVIIKGGSKKWVWGDPTNFLAVGDLKFLCSPEVFVQNHAEQSLKIYQQIIDLLSHKKQATILDLYCGIGISSLLLSQQDHRVIGIEYNPLSIAMAKENAYLNRLTTPQFIEGDVEKILQKEMHGQHADIIILNPPRQGITPTVGAEILRRCPQEIIYVSCMPSTLARDLSFICVKGYKISLIQPYDMFPQTSHVETLVHLIRG
ncbi:23S rRNA (uracil(1939)-C(5))-methyltransferase RlmD [Neochlamydia sp. AcF65]|uniref:23S rRNA (uracil(1939)-C(5))-methyltransferase RlmD n=1 Tax=Neochlamydia sp. AcF65 TaxID=2795735 RepID=UPI001BC9CD14|nr:23S rRNA (uracil(1939)-C(5))-methyltransferase RlmD [Neochlamydia sp. AcF65]